LKLIDLSHVIEDGLTTYPGLPAPSIGTFLSRDESRARYGGVAEFHIGRIDMVANTGTYLDAPSHRWEDGVDTSGLALESIAALPGIVIEHGSQLAQFDVRGRAVLIRSNWSRHWGTPAYLGSGSPFVSKGEAEQLVSGGAALVGIDSLNIDDMNDHARPVAHDSAARRHPDSRASLRARSASKRGLRAVRGAA
jgi:kynurenine formamidase